MFRTWVLGLVLLAGTSYLVLRSLEQAEAPVEDDLVAALAGKEAVSLEDTPRAPMPLERRSLPVSLGELDDSDSSSPSPSVVHEQDPSDQDERSLPGESSTETLEELPEGGAITFRRPGGGRLENRDEARRESFALVRQAEQAETPYRMAVLLSRALASGGLTVEEWDGIYANLLEINKSGLLNPEDREGCYHMEVESGDSLWKVCQRVAADGHAPVAAGIIRLMNGFSGNNIYLGQKLKLPVEPVWMRVEKGHYRLTVMVGEVLIRRYYVGLGKAGSPTPEGEFHIATLQKEPSWFQPERGEIPFGDKDNVLGTRWMGFKERPSFGVHGTWEPDSIGGNFSNGCLRMKNEDVEELFEWIPRGTRIEIHP